MHYEPLRPNRQHCGKERHEFTHGANSVCVYDIDFLVFIKEIPVGTHTDCHATSVDNRFLYIACFEGLYCIDQTSLQVTNILDTGRIYATNTQPDDDSMLVHNLRGAVLLVKNLSDMARIHLHNRVPVIQNGAFRCEIGGKGNLIENGR